MTKLEKRQMMLFGKYRKQGVVTFVLRWGAFSALVFAIVDFLNDETFPKMPSYISLLACLVFGPLFTWAMWYFVMWYFGTIKKKLRDAGELEDSDA